MTQDVEWILITNNGKTSIVNANGTHVAFINPDLSESKSWADTMIRLINRGLRESFTRSSLKLCELENSNLRKCLAWTGQHLTQEQRAALAQRIRSPLQDSGVTIGPDEDREEELAEFKKLCVQAAELLREVINSPGTELSQELDTKNWGGRAEGVASKLMEFDPPAAEATLAEIRNTVTHRW